jgi:hypothetical protein
MSTTPTILMIDLPKSKLATRVRVDSHCRCCLGEALVLQAEAVPGQRLQTVHADVSEARLEGGLMMTKPMTIEVQPGSKTDRDTSANKKRVYLYVKTPDKLVVVCIKSYIHVYSAEVI